MNTLNKSFRMNMRSQAGFSLMEAVVAMSISLVVTAAMVALMANSLGSASRIVNMTKLSEDMRATMQMLTRDVRRASYNANAYLCYGNDDCFKDGSLTLAGDITVDAGADCFTYQLDRNNDGNSTDSPAGGFRRVVVGKVGTIEMWTGTGSNVPDCAANDPNWVEVTNPASMDITSFNVNTALSYTEVIYDNGAGTVISQKVRKLRFTLDGRLVTDNSITRRMEDVISVRNDLLL